MKELSIAKQITNRESQSLDKYLLEIGKVDLITAGEEVILAKRIQEGDQIALEKLVKANLRFVICFAILNSFMIIGFFFLPPVVALVTNDCF